MSSNLYVLLSDTILNFGMQLNCFLRLLKLSSNLSHLIALCLICRIDNAYNNN